MHLCSIYRTNTDQSPSYCPQPYRVSHVMICVPAQSQMRGGAYSLAEDIARGLTDKNIKVYFVAFDAQLFTIQDCLTKQSITHHLSSRYAAIGTLVLYLKSLCIDILHCHLDVAFIASISAFLVGIPSVRTIHGRLDRPGMLVWWEQIAFRIAVRGLQQRVIAVSDQVRADLISHYNLKPQIDVFEIPNGTHLNLLQSREYTGQGKLVFIFIGRFEKYKGFEELIHAFLKVYAQYPYVQLHLVGDGQEKKLLDSHLVASDAIIVSEGWQPRSVVREYMRNAHVFILPSHSEGLSIALLDAMVIGLVPVVSQAANAYNLVENRVNGCVFATQSSEQLQEHLHFLASSPQSLAAYRVAARATVVANFSLERCIDRHLTLYQWIIDRALPPRCPTQP